MVAGIGEYALEFDRFVNNMLVDIIEIVNKPTNKLIFLNLSLDTDCIPNNGNLNLIIVYKYYFF